MKEEILDNNNLSYIYIGNMYDNLILDQFMENEIIFFGSPKNDLCVHMHACLARTRLRHKNRRQKQFLHACKGRLT